jgi:hypothetical protein
MAPKAWRKSLPDGELTSGLREGVRTSQERLEEQHLGPMEQGGQGTGPCGGGRAGSVARGRVGVELSVQRRIVGARALRL